MNKKQRYYNRIKDLREDKDLTQAEIAKRLGLWQSAKSLRNRQNPQENFSLLLTYENGEKRVLDMKSTLEQGGVFTPFRQYENFKRVYIDDCNNVAWDIDPNIDSNVVWNNKVDICSDSCYVDSVPL